MASERGVLIVFEGLDRSGKSTQCQRQVDLMREDAKSVHHMRFPNRSSPTGQMINNYLTGQSQQDDHAIHLLFSANRWEAVREIEDHINVGTTVFIDRYYYSGCVYSAAKRNPSMDLAWCRNPEVGLPRPDICIFLDISSEAQAKRGGFGTERYEKRELQDRVRELYKEMMQHEDESEDIVTVDAEGSVEEVERKISDVLSKKVREVRTSKPKLRYIRRW